MTSASHSNGVKVLQPLRIGWASPVDLQSAIGRVSADVTNALIRRGHSVRFISTESQYDPNRRGHPTNARVVHWSQIDPVKLRADFDVLVVNIGDNYLFHAGIFHLFGKLPCVGIFHDFYLYNLFNGWLEDVGRGDSLLRETIITRTYGSHMAALAGKAQRGELSLEAMGASLPMTEWIARRCSGALGHASFYLNRLAACPGPVSKASMPVTGRGVALLAPKKNMGVTVVTVGVMNPNKCVSDVITAIAASPKLKTAVTYRLVGPIEPAESERLKGVARDCGFGGLAIFGAVDDAELKAHLNAADIICCLRRPVLEGASGSAIEGLLAGRPIIVADTGFYAEIPDDLVFKVPPDINSERLTAQLEHLAENEMLRISVGKKAKAWAEKHFHVACYVAGLESLMTATIEAETILAVGRVVGAELQKLGLAPENPAVGRIAETLEDIFAHA